MRRNREKRLSRRKVLSNSGLNSSPQLNLKIPQKEQKLRTSGKSLTKVEPKKKPEFSLVLPKNIPFVEHRVGDKSVEFLRKNKKGLAKIDAPYGEHTDRDPNSWVWDPNTKFGLHTDEEKKSLPIAGPANWNQLWPDSEAIGEDWKKYIPKKKPLLKNQMRFLRKGKKKREKSRQLIDIKWGPMLGKGGFSTVWKVRASKWNGRTNTYDRDIPLASKVIRLTGVQNCDRNKLLWEVNLMKSDILALRYLSHENICNLIEVITIPDRKTGFPFAALCLFMDLCDGDLEKLIRWDSSPDTVEQSCLIEQLSKHWFKQIACAVKHLHDHNVVHLDIKSANIFYRYNGRLTSKVSRHVRNIIVRKSTFKLGDFGLSVSHNEECVLRGVRGIVSYIYQGPEMFNQKLDSVLTKPCDIHSLGKTLLESGGGEQALFDCYYSKDPIDLVDNYHISKDMEDLIRVMTKRNPKTRHTIDEVLKHKWLSNTNRETDSD